MKSVAAVTERYGFDGFAGVKKEARKFAVHIDIEVNCEERGRLLQNSFVMSERRKESSVQRIIS
jgi:hypothetical protein